MPGVRKTGAMMPHVNLHNFSPTVSATPERGAQVYDIYSLLLAKRTVLLATSIDDQVAQMIVAQLLFLDSTDSTREMQLYINTPGGTATAGLAIYDTLQQLTAPVRTVATGLTAGVGTLLLAAGSRGRRSALPHATIHMQLPRDSAQGQATDIMIQAEQSHKLRDRMAELLARHTGQTLARIHRDAERGLFLTPTEAVAYGLVDDVLEHISAQGTEKES
jgi:ATP-dependent Clp protease, protease subunit